MKNLYRFSLVLVTLVVALAGAKSYAAEQSAQNKCKTYNNSRPSGGQVDAIEIRPNLMKNGAQLWFHSDGRWDGQGGKFSLFFPSQAALSAYCANPVPSLAELRKKASAEKLCPSSVGKGQKWLVF